MEKLRRTHNLKTDRREASTARKMGLRHECVGKLSRLPWQNQSNLTWRWCAEIGSLAADGGLTATATAATSLRALQHNLPILCCLLSVRLSASVYFTLCQYRPPLYHPEGVEPWLSQVTTWALLSFFSPFWQRRLLLSPGGIWRAMTKFYLVIEFNVESRKAKSSCQRVPSPAVKGPGKGWFSRLEHAEEVYPTAAMNTAQHMGTKPHMDFDIRTKVPSRIKGSLWRHDCIHSSRYTHLDQVSFRKV